MGDLFDYAREHYPTSPGWRDPTTSREAAERAGTNAAKLRGQVRALLRDQPLSVHQAAEIMGMKVASIQPRFSELRKLGLIEPSGERHVNDSGASAHIWRLTTRGYQEIS